MYACDYDCLVILGQFSFILIQFRRKFLAGYVCKLDYFALAIHYYFDRRSELILDGKLPIYSNDCCGAIDWTYVGYTQ